MTSNDLLENPADLLREVRESFIIEQDVEALVAIDQKIEAIRTTSQQKLHNKRIEVSKLEIQLESSESRVEELSSDLDRVKEESQALIGQNDIIDYVKELDDLEQSIVQLRSQLDERVAELVKGNGVSLSDTSFEKRGASRELLDTDEQIEIAKDPVAKANILKLKLFRSLGVVIDGENNQVLIEGTDQDIDVLPLDSDLSDFFKTKYIWDRIKANR